jgi:hypothetical protein
MHGGRCHGGTVDVSIRVKGAVGSAIRDAFEDLDVRTETIFSGSLPDTAAFDGLIARIRDFGLEFVDVQLSGGHDDTAHAPRGTAPDSRPESTEDPPGGSHR